MNFKLSFVICLLVFSLCAPVLAASQAYTSTRFLYSVDYPSTWRVKEISKVTTFLSPRESKEDKFAENVSVVVEDLSGVPQNISLLDYHRKSISNAPRTLPEFKVLEEARTKFNGRDCIAVLYTAKLKGTHFKFKAYLLMVGTDAYTLTFTATEDDFDRFLPEAERMMHSLRVSP
jgi:eukaryotic-like serine/threonine-protein kinase